MTSEHVKIYLPLILGLIAFPQLGETIYTPSLPELAHAFLVTENLAQLTISTFFIGSAFGMLFWGGHSDKVGRRRAMISGLIVYIIGCTMCLASRDID